MAGGWTIMILLWISWLLPGGPINLSFYLRGGGVTDNYRTAEKTDHTSPASNYRLINVMPVAGFYFPEYRHVFDQTGEFRIYINDKQSSWILSERLIYIGQHLPHHGLAKWIVKIKHCRPGRDGKSCRIRECLFNVPARAGGSAIA